MKQSQELLVAEVCAAKQQQQQLMDQRPSAGTGSSASHSAGTQSSSSSSSELIVCFPDMTLRAARHLMLPRSLTVLPVVSRSGRRWQDRGRRLVGVLEAAALRTTCQ